MARRPTFSYRVAGRIHARRGHGKAAFIDLDDRSGRIQLHARADVLGEESHERLLSLDLGDLIGVDGTAFKTRRGELSLRSRLLAAAREVAPRATREVPRPRGRRDPLPPPRAGPDRERGDPRALHPPHQGRGRSPPLARRPRLPRGGDTGAAAALRRSARPSLHHAPQRARQGPLPPDRDRAVPQAPDRGRARARVRARQGLSQRGHLVQAQPRVHDARVVRGICRLPPRRRGARGARRDRRKGGRL